MPTYVATGADSKSGQDRTISFDADDDAQAAAVAKARGIYTSKLELRRNAQTIDYKSPAPPAVTHPKVAEDATDELSFLVGTFSVRTALILVKTFGIIGLSLAFASIFSRDHHYSYMNSQELLANLLDRADAIFAALLFIAVLLIPLPRR